MKTYTHFLHCILMTICVAALSLATSCSKTDNWWQMRGIVLMVEDLETVDWPLLAHQSGINTIGTHIFPHEVQTFIESDKGRKFLEECEKYGIDVEHQLHSMSDLLPRELFEVDSTMFRMDENGLRTPDANCCAHSEHALEIICENLKKYASALPSTNHHYYFWVDDNKPMCNCPECAELSQSEQALLIENRMIAALREVDPQAQLAHLAYIGTMPAPVKVQPAEGIFLEFGPFYRVWDKPLSDTLASSPRPNGHGITHGEYIRHLKENLAVFGAENAVILEYWLDASLFSNWKKPAVQIPWHREVFEDDLKTYRSLGIRNITTFGAYMDSTYFAAYPDKTFLREYGLPADRPL